MPSGLLFHGIDPGQHGAWAIVDADGELLRVWDLPLLPGEKRLSVLDLDIKAKFEVTTECVVYVERFLARWATEAHIRSAINYGRILSALERFGREYTEVTSAVWKRAMGVMRKKGEHRSTKAKKARSMRLAEELWGDRFERDDQAEAALIAEHARRTWKG